jgi:hypothetical protein
MRRYLFLFGLYFSVTTTVAQIGNVEKPFRIQLYTGGPSMLKMAFNYSNKFQDAVSYKGLPGIGGEIGYKFNDWFSLGFDFNYRYGQVDFDILDSTLFEEIDDKWNIDLGSFDPFGHYTLKIPRLRGTLVANFHVLPAEKRSDLYFSLGVGFNKVRARLYLDDQKINFQKLGNISMPLAYRTSIGYAYHFTENLGIFSEVGLGGPLISAGLTARF